MREFSKERIFLLAGPLVIKKANGHPDKLIKVQPMEWGWESSWPCRGGKGQQQQPHRTDQSQQDSDMLAAKPTSRKRERFPIPDEWEKKNVVGVGRRLGTTAAEEQQKKQQQLPIGRPITNR